MDVDIVDKIAVLYGRIVKNSFVHSYGPDFIKSNMAKMVFYSSAIEGNTLEEDTALMLINGNFVLRDGKFVNYIELLNHKETYELIAKMGDHNLSIDSIIEVHESLFKNLFNKLYAGPRRSMTSIDDFITEDASSVPSALKRLLEMINKKTPDSKDVFLNAIDWHLEFVDVHPFEDGNGRTVRMLMNWYLFKNGMAPFLVTANCKKDYFNTLGLFHFCKYKSVFAAFVLYSALESSGQNANELITGIGNGKEDRLIRDYLTIFKGNMDQQILENEVHELYATGDKDLIIGSLWIAGHSKIALTELSSALDSDDSDITSAALLSMLKRATDNMDGGVAALETHSDRIKQMALNGSNNLERLLAISALGKMWLLDKSTAAKLFEEHNTRIAAQVLNALRYNPNNQDSLDLIKEHMKSDNIDIKLNAYIAFLNNAPLEQSAMLTKNLINEKDEIKDETIKWLARFKKEESGKKKSMLNTDEMAGELAKLSEKDKRIKKLLLGHLSYVEGLNAAYVNMLNSTIKNTQGDETERAYAIYKIGKTMDYDYLNSKTGVKVGEANAPIINMAIFLPMTEQKGNEREIIEALDLKNNSLNMVQAVGISNMLSRNAFGSNFLSLCERNFSAWRAVPPNS